MESIPIYLRIRQAEDHDIAKTSAIRPNAQGRELFRKMSGEENSKELEELESNLAVARKKASRRSVLKSKKPGDLADWLKRASAALVLLSLLIIIDAVMVFSAYETLARVFGQITLVPIEAVIAFLSPLITELDLLEIILVAFLGLSWYMVARGYNARILRLAGLSWILLSAVTLVMMGMGALPAGLVGPAAAAFSVSPIVFAGVSANNLIWVIALLAAAVGIFSLERQIGTGSLTVAGMLLIASVVVGWVIPIVLFLMGAVFSWLHSTERRQKVIRGI